MNAVEEFEHKWWVMMEAYGQTDNEHFQWLWENRKCWVPVYYMHDFFPFLQTTARSEGFNSVLKKYVNPNNSLVEFAQQYTAIQDKVMASVSKEQLETVYKETEMYSMNPLEMQVRGLYTHNLFCKFQVEMKVKSAYRCDALDDGTFKVSSVRGIIPKYGDRDYHVQANMVEETYSCSCCKFDRDGLLCAHVLRVMDQIGVYEIPEKYILKRWTWDPEEDLIQPDFEQPTVKKSMPEEGKSVMRYTSILKEFKASAKDACLTDDGTRLARKHLYNFKEELETLKNNQLKKARKEKEEAKGSFQGQPDPCSIPVGRMNEDNPVTHHQNAPDARHPENPATQQTSATNVNQQENTATQQESATNVQRQGNPATQQESVRVTIHASKNNHAFVIQPPHPDAAPSSNTKLILDPPKTTTKGRPKSKRKQSGFEIAKPKTKRKCGVCGSLEHDKRTCKSPLAR